MIGRHACRRLLVIPTSAAQTATAAGAGRTPFPIVVSLPEPEDTRTRVWYTVRMRVVLQRVTEASVTVDDETVGAIGAGLVALVGIADGDDASVVERAAAKTAALRIFRDDAGRFDRSVVDVGGSILVVSQFTLLADTRKGNRPSFTGAADPALAEPLVEQYADALRALGIMIETGRFGADMQVSLVNDGPVTIVLDVAP